MKNDFNERKAKRIETALNRAAKNEAESNQLYKTAQDMAGMIPMGQPILVGHHSEKRDRNYRNKIHNIFGKAYEKSNKAEYYEDKAEAIAYNTAIFSDDPEALQKLKSKLKALQELQEFMKAGNKCIKKQDKTGFLALPFATEQLWAELSIPDRFKRTGFPSFKLTNNNATIRATEKRIEELGMQISKRAFDNVINGVRIYENTEANRLQIIFEDKPEEKIRKQLKGYGFRWAPSEGAWQRHISDYALYAAKQIIQNITK